MSIQDFLSKTVSKIAPVTRESLILLHDMAAIIVALVLAYIIRLGTEFSFYFWNNENLAAIGVVLTMAVLLHRLFGVNRGSWRFVSIPDLIAIFQLATSTALLFALFDFLARDELVIPRTVVVLFWVFQIGLLSFSRLLYRNLRDRRRLRHIHGAENKQDIVPVLLMGTGEESELFIRSLENALNPNLDVVGLLTRKSAHVGTFIRSKKVLGLTEQLESVVEELKKKGQAPKRLVLTQEALLKNEQLPGLIAAAKRISLPVNRLSPLELSADPSRRLNLLPVEMEDLLIRPVASVDVKAIAELISGRRVLVTGGGGSIGSEICRQVASLKADTLVVIENSELALHKLTEQIKESYPDLNLQPYIADIRDKDRLVHLFTETKPELVFHAAALKHVHIIERNKSVAFQVNTLGTKNVAEATLACEATAMVNISTDKAIEPTSFLGASKRAAELFCQAINANQKHEKKPTRFISVRFGNVLGSTGSVVWTFRDQIAKGGPITVTHPDMERYFMTISEATSLVLMAASYRLSKDESAASVYVLDMGNPVKIRDMAHKMIAMAGLEPDRDIKIEFTGLRPGERLSEILFGANETIEKIDVEGVMATRPTRMELAKLESHFSKLSKLALSNKDDLLMQAMLKVVPEYHPDKSIKAADKIKAAN